ncbi:MAG: DUF3592 domain-containing protein [Candidatus Obscuribacterales bacterium]|nr:DUF3592 domain-containing protein [Candidatus Obscuribacterales bacterium]
MKNWMNHRFVNVLAVIGLLAFAFYFVDLFKQGMAKQDAIEKKWIWTDAEITEVYRDKTDPGIDLGGFVTPQLETGIRYSYRYKERTCVGEMSMSDGETRTHKAGDRIRIKVNPDNPDESSYER